MSFTLITFEDRLRIRDLVHEHVDYNHYLIGQIETYKNYEQDIQVLRDQIARDEELIRHLALD